MNALSNEENSIEYSCLERCRWNVVDLVTVVAQGAIPATLFCDVDMTWVEDLRNRYLADGVRITETCILLKAIATAQVRHPLSRTISLPFRRCAVQQNISGGFTVERQVNGMPSVFFGNINEPQSKDLEAIMKELGEFSSKPIAEQSQLNMQDKFSRMPWLLRQVILRISLVIPQIRLALSPASFGLSSLGKYGVKEVTGPCVCTSTFGVGAIENRVIVKDQKLQICPQMTLSLLFDERCMDNLSASLFLKDVKELLEGKLSEFF